MPKVDVTTVVIVVVLVFALGFLGYQLYQLYLGQDPPPANPAIGTQQPADTIPDVYNFPEDDGIPPDSAFFSDPIPDKESSSTVSARQSQPTSMGAGDFMVLAGSYERKSNAEGEANRIRGLGYPSTTVEPFNRGRFHVVLVDRFDSQNRAVELARELRTQHNLEAIVQKKKVVASN